MDSIKLSYLQVKVISLPVPQEDSAANSKDYKIFSDDRLEFNKLLKDKLRSEGVQVWILLGHPLFFDVILLSCGSVERLDSTSCLHVIVRSCWCGFLLISLNEC